MYNGKKKLQKQMEPVSGFISIPTTTKNRR